mmetsp:Transcript_105940/g.187415  ORF Transcript_105940/g.187415 Transcript_105940/m.187415 type:complete len:107 (-) Transcript_105940:1981-2301(-)
MTRLGAPAIPSTLCNTLNSLHSNHWAVTRVSLAARAHRSAAWPLSWSNRRLEGGWRWSVARSAAAATLHLLVKRRLYDAFGQLVLLSKPLDCRVKSCKGAWEESSS